MKKLLLGLLLTVGATSIGSSQQTKNETTAEFDDGPIEGVVEQSKYDYPVRGLGSSICLLYSSSGQIAKDAKKSIYKYMAKYTPIKNPTTEDMIKYLNLHSKDMHCGGSEKKHYMKYAIDKGVTQVVFFELFTGTLFTDELYEKGIHIEFNAITFTKDGTPETVLDYINKYLQKPIVKKTKAMRLRMEELRDLLADELGAKTFDQLYASMDKEEKLKYKDMLD